jgi:uncharacterized RDD family membrane protein YckC
MTGAARSCIIARGVVKDLERSSLMAQRVSGPTGTTDTRVTGRRVLATIVDTIVLTVVGSALAAVFIGVFAGGDEDSPLAGVAGLLILVFFFAYYIVMEARWGQTVGKMLLGIMVVREETGRPPGLGGAALRTVLRIVDGIASYLVAFVVVLVKPRRWQRDISLLFREITHV